MKRLEEMKRLAKFFFTIRSHAQVFTQVLDVDMLPDN